MLQLTVSNGFSLFLDFLCIGYSGSLLSVVNIYIYISCVAKKNKIKEDFGVKVRGERGGGIGGHLLNETLQKWLNWRRRHQIDGKIVRHRSTSRQLLQWFSRVFLFRATASGNKIIETYKNKSINK